MGSVGSLGVEREEEKMSNGVSNKSGVDEGMPVRGDGKV